MVGESPQALKSGRRVEAVVRFVGQNEAYCRLPELGNMDATLSSADISSQGVIMPSDRLKVGQNLPARYPLVSQVLFQEYDKSHRESCMAEFPQPQDLCLFQHNVLQVLQKFGVFVRTCVAILAQRFKWCCLAVNSWGERLCKLFIVLQSVRNS